MGYLDDLFGLKVKVALLTGGGGVLAGAIGKGLTETGVKVVLADLDYNRAEELPRKFAVPKGKPMELE